MDQQQLTIGVVIVIVAIAVIALVWFVSRQQRSNELRQRFGPEYEREVQRAGDRGRAEDVLAQRKERVEKFQVRPLDPGLAMRLRARWRDVQARFVDDPRGAVGDADRLIGEAMTARGYPSGDFEQRAADVSVDHAQVVSDYRAAHEIAQRPANRTATEDLRKAMVHYRSLFAALVGGADTNVRRVDESVEERQREEQRR